MFLLPSLPCFTKQNSINSSRFRAIFGLENLISLHQFVQVVTSFSVTALTAVLFVIEPLIFAQFTGATD